MARIRSVHPGLFTDEAFVSCSPMARLLLIGLWTEADDQGVFEWKPLTLKMRLLPADNADAAELLDEVATNGIVQRFEVDGKAYGAIRNFRKYQRPKKPNEVHPLPPEFRTYVGLMDQSSEPVPHQSPTKGEKSPQMEDGGGRMKEKNPPTPLSRGERLPADWTLPDDWLAWAKGEGLNEATIRGEADRFRDYWRAQPGVKGRKLDWLATWRNWCRTVKDRQKPRDGPLSANGLGIPDLTNA